MSPLRVSATLLAAILAAAPAGAQDRGASGIQPGWQIHPPSWSIVPGGPRISPDTPVPQYALPPPVQFVPVIPFYGPPPHYVMPPQYPSSPDYQPQPGPRFPRAANGLGW